MGRQLSLGGDRAGRPSSSVVGAGPFVSGEGCSLEVQSLPGKTAYRFEDPELLKGVRCGFFQRQETELYC